MGLKDYKEFKKKQMINEVIDSFLSSLNITIEDIKSIKEMKLEIEKLKFEVNELKSVKPVEFSEDDKKNIKEYNDSHKSIEDIMKQFEGKVEEFYPYGKPKA